MLMKTTISGRPRFTCRLVRVWISMLGDATAVEERGLGSRHLASCDACRRFFEACRELEGSLKRDASRRSEFDPTGLEERILRAIHLADRPPRRTIPGFTLISLAGAAVGVALAVFIFRGLLPQKTMEARSAKPPDAAEIVMAATAAPARLWTSLMPAAKALQERNPLQDEVDSVYSEARSAARGLALNFLPSSPENPSGGKSNPGWRNGVNG